MKLKPKYFFFIGFAIITTGIISLDKVSAVSCNNSQQCATNQTCESPKCKGKVGANCNAVSRMLSTAEWDTYKATPSDPNINTRIDPADDCKIELFCDNKKKCCAYGSCDWQGTQPNEPTPPSDTDPDDDNDDTDPTNPVFDDGNSLDDTEFGGGIQATNDTSIDSGDATTGGIGAGSADRSISLPDTELNDTNSSLLGEVERLINWTLGFLGILVFSMMLFAGFEYATAGGDENKTTKAISRIKSTVIGLVILFFAFVTTNLVVGLALGRI